MSYTIILEAVVGSTLHGTSVDDGLEDLDLMAVVLEHPAQLLGFQPKDTWTARTKPQGVRSEAGDTDWVAYGLRKYLSLALKGNPSILLPLFAPANMVRIETRIGAELRALYPKLISKQCFGPFRGYMHKQYERLIGTRGQMNVTRPELIAKYGYDTKYAGHIVRLGLQGKELLSKGKLSLPMDDYDRRWVVAVRSGVYPFEGIIECIKHLETELVAAYEQSTLPDKPDYEYVEQWMITKYLDNWSEPCA